MKKFCLSLLAGLLSVSALAQNLTYKVTAENLNIPWEIIWGQDDHIWMTERPGTLSRLDPETAEKKVLLTLSNIQTGGERGLMGMAILYTAIEDIHVYIAYTYNSGGSTKIRVERYTKPLAADTLISPITIIENIAGSSIHDGCRLFIDGEYLYITTGDAGDTDLPQNNNSINGKILRVNLNGTIPSDNPIPGSPIWSKGHRNPQGLVIHNGTVYSSEHGPDTDDEVNIIKKGHNYGWPDVRGFCNEPAEINFCNDSNITEPVAAWTPTLAVAGLDFYQKATVPPTSSQFENSLLLASLKAGQFIQLKLNTEADSVIEKKVIINNTYGRLRDVCISPSGRIFVSTSNSSSPGAPVDKIIEIIEEPTGIKTSSGNRILVYPNPLKYGESVNIDFEKFSSGSYTITDVKGNKMSGGNFKDIKKLIVPSAKLGTGIYFINIRRGEGSVTEKILIKD